MNFNMECAILIPFSPTPLPLLGQWLNSRKTIQSSNVVVNLIHRRRKSSAQQLALKMKYTKNLENRLAILRTFWLSAVFVCLLNTDVRQHDAAYPCYVIWPA